jgi:hypothetical protein
MRAQNQSDSSAFNHDSPADSRQTPGNERTTTRSPGEGGGDSTANHPPTAAGERR